MLCYLPEPPYIWKKLGLLFFLFIFQFIHDYSMESLITSYPSYNTMSALAISNWSTLPAFGLSLWWCSFAKVKSIKPPQSAVLKVSIGSYASSVISMISLKHVPYLFRIIFKSIKPISVAGFKKITGNPVPKKKLRAGLLMVTGTIIFIYKPALYKTKINKLDVSYLLGISFLFVSLLLDGIIGATEDKYLRNKKLHPAYTMYNVNAVRILLSTPVIIYYKLYTELFLIIQTNYKNFFLISITNPISQLCLFYALSEFGSFNTLMITTIRKFTSVMVSMLVFKYTMAWYHLIGLVFIFGGLRLFIPNRYTIRKNHNYEKLMNMV